MAFGWSTQDWEPEKKKVRGGHRTDLHLPAKTFGACLFLGNIESRRQPSGKKHVNVIIIVASIISGMGALVLAWIMYMRKTKLKNEDFGLARSFGGDQTEAETNRVVGTYGYMSPEYTIDGIFSVKSDVYSFGVLVLEIISGKRNRGFCHSDHNLNLLGHAWRLWNEERAVELIDKSLDYSAASSEILRYIHVGRTMHQCNASGCGMLVGLPRK
ncbi:hypothetical protein Q3G72_011007 [Acer saccharum]|nr:hypothetical protein Q3G72_011007 [Acer saccharum]